MRAGRSGVVLVAVTLAAGCGGGSAATSQVAAVASSAPPTTTPPKSTAPTSTDLVVAPPPPTTHKRKAKRPRGKLCIYPGAGRIHIISHLPVGIADNAWANACALNGGHPAIQLSPRHYLEPFSNGFYKLYRRGAGGSVFVVPEPAP